MFSTQTPALQNASDGVPYELGMKFQTVRPGRVTAIRYWKAASDTGTHIGHIWSSTGTSLASATFTSETASGWQQQALSTPLVIQANTTYTVSVNIASNYAFTDGGLATAIVNGDVRSVADGSNGVFGAAFAFPTGSYHSANYFRDIVFLADAVASIAKVSGDKQTGTASAPLANPFVVVVRDVNNNPKPNTSVTFSITSGTGSVLPTTAVTDSSGQASTRLTLGASGRTMVTATAAGIGSVTFQASVPNAVYLENQQPGTTAWEIANPVTDTAPEIAGYAGATSVNKGGTLPFKISVAQPGQYSIAVYRLGHYAGTGGRLMGSFGPFAGVTQPACAVTDATTRLIECNWTTSFTLSVGSTWTSGLYTANLTELTTGKQSQIWFVVRDDSSHADLLFQSSFNTFLAYNNYGDSERHSLYEYNSTNGQRAYKVSLDRPFGEATVDPSNNNNINRYERNMARWLESQSYDVTYVTTLDVHLTPAILFQHKTYLSVGHDEYWSLEMRNGVEAARDGGVNLGFFSANSAYWRVRFEPSSSGEPNRVMVCYKDPLVGDPVAPTYLWRGPENNRPENALLGVMYVGDNDASGGFDYIVSNAADPYYLNTGLTNNTAILQLVGYEWDAVVNNGFTPPGLVVLSSSTVDPTSVAPGLPSGTSTTTSNSARYTASSGAKVFATGSIQFAWGLNSDDVSPPRDDTRIKQFAINVLKDLGATPLTPDDGMIVP
ncbi:MAG: N,N-dimethylformamidase beta subunit family domain-containing protein [Betaproteobacteria bacterium]